MVARSTPPEPAVPVPPLHPTLDPARPFVLVVDDSPDMRGLIGDILTGEGFEVVTVGSATRALDLMAERRPDLLITDLLMPGMSGFSLRSLMLRRPELAGVPVVVISAYWHRPSETLEVVDVLSKPINIDRLIATVLRVTNRAAGVSS